MDLRCGCFLVKMYVKTKELGPMGGACSRHAPPTSANAKLPEKYHMYRILLLDHEYYVRFSHFVVNFCFSIVLFVLKTGNFEIDLYMYLANASQ